MRKNNRSLPANQRYDLPGIAYILAFLIGILLYLLFVEPVLGIKPDPIWIALLMGLLISTIMFWVWDETRNKDDHDN